jgi:hypothetical protein
MQDLIIATIPLLIALTISCFRYHQLEPRWLRLFTWFLMVTFIMQTSGYFYSLAFKKSNHFIFNLYILIEYSFYPYIFSKTVKAPFTKKLIKVALLGFVLFYIYQIFLHGQFFIYSSLTSNIGKFLTLICCMCYFADLLMDDELIVFFNTPMFWITTGIMFAAVGDFLYLSFFDYIMNNRLDADGNIYGIMETALSIIEYGFFCIGFSCKKTWIKAN